MEMILILIIHNYALFLGHCYIELFLQSESGSPESGNSQGLSGSRGEHNFHGGCGGK